MGQAAIWTVGSLRLYNDDGLQPRTAERELAEHKPLPREHYSFMRSKVFVGCGQRPPERDVARSISRLLGQRGFDVYLAVNAQTILEINTGIIGELKNSDCYIFVNFRRDLIGDEYRGSLFSHQELAIAYALGFERILVVNQRSIMSEGMLRYIGINTEEFEGFDDCCAVVERALDRSG